MPPLKLRIGTLAAALAAALVQSACGGEPPAEDALIRPVRTTLVRSTGSERIRRFSGSAEAGTEIDLSFKVPGTIDRIHVRVGDPVEIGQVVAELDDTDYALRVGEAEAGLALRTAEARNAHAQYDRVRELYENNDASPAELDEARARAESSGSLRDAASKQLELARKQQGYTRLYAPLDGGVSVVPGSENENVAVGQPVVVVASGAAPQVKVSIPELLISQVRQGERVRVRFPSVEGESFVAIITEVGVSAVGGRTAFPVTVELEEDDDEIRPGMAAEVEFRFRGEGADRIVVPTVAVGEDRSGRFVFVVESGADDVRTARRRAVEVGTVSSEGLEVLSGLDAGELVVTAGVRRIEDGLAVRLLGGPESEAP